VKASRSCRRSRPHPGRPDDFLKGLVDHRVGQHRPHTLRCLRHYRTFEVGTPACTANLAQGRGPEGLCMGWRAITRVWSRTAHHPATVDPSPAHVAIASTIARPTLGSDCLPASGGHREHLTTLGAGRPLPCSLIRVVAGFGWVSVPGRV